MEISKSPIRFYATLLDSYQDYLDTPIIYEKYWGFAAEPPFTLDEFWVRQRASLIDRINRVPFTSEAASKGTAFNAIIDNLIAGVQDEKVKLSEIRAEGTTIIAIKAEIDGFTFTFPYALCREFADYYKGAITQVLTEAPISTYYGDVVLYGYMDYLMSLSIHDLKTTGSYYAGKFKHHFQHLVYPYCLMQNGMDLRVFEYNIAEIDKYGRCATYTETYVFNPTRDIPKLKAHCEGLIEFVLDNLQYITDQRIFGGENPPGYVGAPVDINILKCA